ncbi:MAG: hypothetical protein O6924_07015 [Alphaproteobacteria bacterium]|nr:hypothetical protein [Alphaproteobacteria bacterium]
MKTPARPMAGAAGAEIESKDIRNRSCSTPRPVRQTGTVDVPPNWRHIGTVLDNLLAGITVASS